MIVTIVALNQVRLAKMGSWRTAMRRKPRFVGVFFREIRWILKIPTTLKGWIAACMLADIVFALVIVVNEVEWDWVISRSS